MKTMQSKGFTLVELLVVIAIIGILIGMLLPAVQQVREAARRTQCQNNIRQLALACHNFESAGMTFPPGLYYDGPPNNLPMYGWNAFILPFMEQNNISDLLDVPRNKLNSFLGNPILSNGSLDVQNLRCPSDSGPPEFDDLLTQQQYNGGNMGYRTWGRSGTNDTPPMSNYVGSSHHGRPNTNIMHETRGIFTMTNYQGSKAKGMGEVFDGTSNVSLIGERAWLVGDVPYNAAVYLGAYRGRDNDAGRDIFIWNPGINLPKSSGLNNYMFASSSLHPGGVNMAFADGSAHFINEFTTTDMMTVLIQCDSGQVLGSF